MARLCKLTTVCVGGGLRLVSLLKKTGLNNRLSFQKMREIILFKFLKVCCRGLTDIPEALSVLEFASA